MLRTAFWRHGFFLSNRASSPQQQRKQQVGEKSTIGAAGQCRQQDEPLEDFERELRSWTNEKSITTTSIPRSDLKTETHSHTSSENNSDTVLSQPARRNAVCKENLGWDLELGFSQPGETTQAMDGVYRIGPRPLLPEPEPSPTEPQPVIPAGLLAPQLHRERTWNIMPPIAEVITHESRSERRN